MLRTTCSKINRAVSSATLLVLTPSGTAPVKMSQEERSVQILTHMPAAAGPGLPVHAPSKAP
eukprot:3677902-Lingulodinium_polyedra.AAC.1